jgi:hypothetical protein
MLEVYSDNSICSYKLMIYALNNVSTNLCNLHKGTYMANLGFTFRVRVRVFNTTFNNVSGFTFRVRVFNTTFNNVSGFTFRSAHKTQI